MRWSALLTALVLVGIFCLAGGSANETCAVLLRLVDSTTGREIPGLVRISDSDGKQVAVNDLLSRGFGLVGQLGVEEGSPIHRWRAARCASINLPRAKVVIEAISGLETESASVSLDLTGKATSAVTIPLTRFENLGSRGYRSANTHVHLMKASRQDCDRYLKEVTMADGLDALFLSYLERAGADHEYTSNKYTDGDLASLSREAGVTFGNGEEHRHNLEGYGEGYGHVMLLNITQLVQPVSIGPGIMRMGTDGIPLRRGIDSARKDGAFVLWCHNRFGMEDLPNLVTGRIDAQNIFDGSVRDSYKDSFYRYLDIGLQVPFSTGTDWFIYDFSRVYCQMKGALTVENWLKSLSQGRSFITNGPLLELTVADKGVGETLDLARPGTVHVIALGRGRRDFENLELVQNGDVVRTEKTHAVGGHFEAQIETDIEVREPTWLALRTPPPPVKDDPALLQPVPKNELGCDLFAHTSAVSVTVDGQRRFVPAVARELLEEMQTSMALIAKEARFADDEERQRVLDVYRDGIEVLETRISQPNSPQRAK